MLKVEPVQSCFWYTGQLAQGFEDPSAQHQAFLAMFVSKCHCMYVSDEISLFSSFSNWGLEKCCEMNVTR